MNLKLVIIRYIKKKVAYEKQCDGTFSTSTEFRQKYPLIIYLTIVKNAPHEYFPKVRQKD